ncbi:hypothetical protein EBO34_09220 [Alteribacter keqinensis]|uniref:Methyl-accepting transducer domain-containing protein n=2 Tax=Alteribacter keqinensis TaxID=2483800 RepID=A0A3M7TWW0_9BACI|nr:hypothetical protein EBO34_09220 [Alteribacter keqinensis]
MGRQLEQSMRVSSEASVQVFDVSEAVSKESQSQLEQMGTVLETMTDFKQHVQTQAEETDTISAITEEVSASALEIKESSGKVTIKMQQMNGMAASGATAVSEMAGDVEALSRQTHTMAEKMIGMVEEVENIAAFMKGIDDISAQTNLLAINASIEAAKAGAAGRSFAVVAEEIRKLSNGTSDFSKNTKKAIEHIRDETVEMKGTFHSFESASLKAKEQSEEATSLFSRIETESKSLHHEQEETSVAIEQINRAIEEVVTAVANLSDVAKELEEKTGQVTETIGFQSEKQRQLAETTLVLKETASSLQQ